MAHFRKLPADAKNLANISYTSRAIANFVSDFVAMTTWVGWGKCDWQHSMAHPLRPFMDTKNLAEIFHTS